MADKYDILLPHKARQKVITGRKIGVPPLDQYHIRLLTPDIVRRPYDIKRICRMEHVFCTLYLKTVIAVVPLFFMKKKFRVLHLVGDHLHSMPFRQLSVHESCVVGYTAFIRIDRSD